MTDAVSAISYCTFSQLQRPIFCIADAVGDSCLSTAGAQQEGSTHERRRGGGTVSTGLTLKLKIALFTWPRTKRHHGGGMVSTALTLNPKGAHFALGPARNDAIAEGWCPLP